MSSENLKWLSLSLLRLPWLAAAVVLSACTSPRILMPTPEVYTRGIQSAFSERLPEDLRSPEMSIVYVTDRIPTSTEEGAMTYGIGRNRSFALGQAVVGFGGGTSWDDLVADTRVEERRRPLKMKVQSVTEEVRTPEYPLRYKKRHGRTGTDPAALDEEAKARAAAQRVIRKRLADSPKNEVLIYVHGFATKFDQALYTTAGLWHFMGREFVPVTYSWPAGRGNLLRGYAYDRESGEHTLFTFKRFLRWVSSMPEVDGIHLIAHSRGADVTITTLRELAIESRARGEDPGRRYKIRNVVLAAPDISGEIGFQRLTDGSALSISDRWLTYTSGRDKAIGIAEYLFSDGRWGRLGWNRLDEEERKAIEFYTGFFGANDATVKYGGRLGGNFGHEFFMADPVASSDLVLALRYGRRPGPEHGRPLEHRGALVWAIDEDYFDRPPE